MKTQKLLDEETERNKDDVAHCEALQKHYDDRVTVYEVRSSIYQPLVNLTSDSATGSETACGRSHEDSAGAGKRGSQPSGAQEACQQQSQEAQEGSPRCSCTVFCLVCLRNGMTLICAGCTREIGRGTLYHEQQPKNRERKSQS